MRTIQSVLAWYHQYFGTGAMGLAFALALVWLWKKRRGFAQSMALALTGIVISAVCFFPLTARVIMKIIGERVYWRVFWMLPLVSVLALAMTELVSQAGREDDESTNGGTKRASVRLLDNKRLRKTGAALLCLVLIGINGSFVFSDTFFTPRENNYKLPTPVIRVADAIQSHAKASHIKKRRRRIVGPISIAETIRLYDAGLKQYYGRSAESNPAMQGTLYQQINADEPDYELLAECVRRARLRYVILTTSQDNREAMENLAFEVIFDDNGYVVYFDMTRYRGKLRKKLKE